MGKKARKHYRNVGIEKDDEFDDLFDDDFDAHDLSRDIHSTEWGDDDDGDKRVSARRKIERRNDSKKLYSQLDDWEEYGKNSDNYIY